MKTYKITLTCTDPSEIDVKEMATPETEAEARARRAVEFLEAVFKGQGTAKEFD